MTSPSSDISRVTKSLARSSAVAAIPDQSAAQKIWIDGVIVARAIAGKWSSRIAASGKRAVRAQGLLRMPRIPMNCASRVALNSVSDASAAIRT